MAFLEMTPPTDYIIYDYNLSDIYYTFTAGRTYHVFKGEGKQYNRFKNMVIDRDGTICADCGKYGSTIHHIRPAKLFPTLYYCMDNIIVLCKSCHKERHMVNEVRV